MNDTTGVPHESHQSLFALEHKWTEFDEFTWAQDELELINLFQKGDDVDDGDSFKWTQEGYKLVSSPIDSRNTTNGITQQTCLGCNAQNSETKHTIAAVPYSPITTRAHLSYKSRLPVPYSPISTLTYSLCPTASLPMKKAVLQRKYTEEIKMDKRPNQKEQNVNVNSGSGTKDYLDHTFKLFSHEDYALVNPVHLFIMSDILQGFVVCGKTKEEPVSMQGVDNKHTIGFRCVWCLHKNPKRRKPMSSVFPRKLSSIYRAVLRFQRDHIEHCPCIPKHIRNEYLRLKKGECKRSKKIYWEEKASQLGLCNDSHGIVFKGTKRKWCGDLQRGSGTNHDTTKKCSICSKAKRHHSYIKAEWVKVDDKERICRVCKRKRGK